MTEGRYQRKLAAVVAVDTVGYSRLMGRDEEGTHARLKELWRALVDPTVAKCRGRVIKNTGDGVLIEFASVVDAVRCALGIQCGMAERNAEFSPEQRIEFRIGINLGDVIVDEGEVYGD